MTASPPDAETPTTPVELTARFVSMLRYLEAHGGTVQRTVEKLVEDLNAGSYNAVKMMMARAVEIGVISRTGMAHPTIGVGRLPNVYRLLMSPDEYVARRDVLRQVMLEKRAQAKGRAKTAKRAAKRATARQRDEILDAVHQAVETPASATVIHPEYPELPDAEVAAWADAVDFDYSVGG